MIRTLAAEYTVSELCEAFEVSRKDRVKAAAASPCSIACRNDHEHPSAMLRITQVSGNDVLIGANARGCVAEDREGR